MVLLFKRYTFIFSLLLSLLFTTANAQYTLYVSPDGNTENSGDVDNPTTLQEALNKAAIALGTTTVQEQGVKISLEGGNYFYDQRFVLGNEFQGTAEAPIIIEAMPGADVQFEGGLSLSSGDFGLVTDVVERGWLAASAVDSIKVTTITDPRMIAALSEELLSYKLNINGKAYDPSVFPNDDGSTKVWAYLENEPIAEEVSPPGIIDFDSLSLGFRTGQGIYQEPGKPQNWYGSIDEPRGALAGMATGEEHMAGTWQQWEDELKRNNRRNFMFGLMEAVWKLNKIEIDYVDAAQKALRLAKVLQYTYRWDPAKGASNTPYHEFKVFGLLCEVDKPGEWFFDTNTNKLYVYPIENTTEINVSFPVAEGFFHLTPSTKYVTIKGLSVKNAGGDIVYHVEGNNNTISSAEVRNCSARGVEIGGQNNLVDGCDFVDLQGHMVMRGGSASLSGFVDGNNIVQNCHFYQKDVNSIKVGMFINGRGNIFRNNLVHNSIRQSLDLAGTGHLVEKNEFFNIGFTEGDGGAIYAGQNMTGYGNTFKHNFIHHNMGVPGKIGRAGIFMDDHQGGSVCIGNVFYKCAEVAIKYNAGAGHVAKDNIMLEGAYGIRAIGGFNAQTRYDFQLQIDADPSHPSKGKKEDYIGRAESFVGEADGWESSPWKEAYPRMSLVMSDKGQYGRYWPIRYETTNNFYFDNTFNSSSFAGNPPEAMAKNIVADGAAPQKADFMDYDNMDFRAKQGSGLPENIPFDSIGLSLSTTRKEMPSKQYYRNEVRQFFDGINSMPGTNMIMNTGVMIENAPVERPLLETEADIVSFEFENIQIDTATIDTINHKINVTVEYNTDVTALSPVFEISTGAYVNVASGQERDFSGSVTYRVASQDGLTVNYWEINVTVALNDKAEILSFNLGDIQEGTSVIDVSNRNIDAVVNYGVDLTALSPVFTISSEAKVDVTSGAERDFTNEVIYKVTSQDSSQVIDWKVNVTNALNNQADILGFDFGDIQEGESSIDVSGHNIKVIVKYGTDLTALSPAFTTSPDAMVDFASGAERDFSDEVIYKVTSQDSSKMIDWKINVMNALNDEANILSFNFGDTQQGVESIDVSNHKISVVVKYGIDLTSLSPVFSISPDAKVDFASGVERNFSGEVIYKVTSQDSSQTIDWKVSVTNALNDQADILSFDLGEIQKGEASIDVSNHNIEVTVKYGVDLTALSPSFTVSPESKVDFVSGTERDFSGEVIYKVTSQDSSKTIDWKVNVVNALNDQADILSFGFGDIQEGETVIDNVSNEIKVIVEEGTDLKALLPDFTLSPGAKVDFISGAERDFSSDVIYKVTSEDGLQVVDWKISVTKILNDKADILSFNFGEIQEGEASIDVSTRKVNVIVKYGTDLSVLSAVFTISQGAKVDFASGAERDFSGEVIYKVTSQDSSQSVDWKVSVTNALNNQAEILSFSFGDAQEGESSIDVSDHQINVTVKYGTDLTALSPEFTISPDATVDFVSGTERDFSDDVVYKVTSQDSSKSADWKVTVINSLNNEADMLSFNFGNAQLGDEVIDVENQSIQVTVKQETNVKALSPAFSISPDAQVDFESGVERDFSKEVIYLITSADSSKVKEWKVQVLIGSITNVGKDVVSEVKIYPIPMKEELNISMKETSLISIQNTSGEILITQIIYEEAKIDVASLSNGVYLLKVIGLDSQSVQEFKLLK